MAITLYRQVGKSKARRYKKVNHGKGRRPTLRLSSEHKCGRFVAGKAGISRSCLHSSRVVWRATPGRKAF